MPISFQCALCKGVNTFEDAWANMRAACQRCGNYLTVPAQSSVIPEQFAEGLPPPSPAVRPAAPPPMPEEPTERGAAARSSRDKWGGDLPRERDYDEGRRRGDYGRDDDRDYDIGWQRSGTLAGGWNVVRIALTLMFWSTIAVIAIAVLMVLFMLLMAAAEGGRMGRGPRMDALGPILVLFGLGALVCYLVIFVGLCMCIAAPPESRARGLAVSSVVCIVAAILAYFLGIFLLFFMARGGGRFGGPDFAEIVLPIVVIVAAAGTAIAGQVLHVLYLKAVARYFRNESVAQSTTGLLTLYFVFLGLYLVMIFMTTAVRNPDAGFMVLCLGLILLGIGIAVIVWYLIVLARTRASIG